MSYSIGAVRLKLKVLADKCGSQKNLARRSGFSEQFLSDVIRGKRPPTDRILKAIGLKRVVIYIAKESR